MPKPIQPLTIAAPGFLGLNTQNRGSVLPPGWATVANNIVYDDFSRMAARQGSKATNSTAVSGSPTIDVIHEYIDGSGNTLNIFAANNKLYKEVSGTITAIDGGANLTTPTGDDWQFANFNGWCVGYQSGHKPILLETTATASFVDADDFGGVGTKTVFNGTACLAAYGRLWTVLNSTLYYSDLLIHNFTGGSSGNFDLGAYWPDGMDEGVALADFNGYLVVFGKNSIIIYENPDDVTNMAIVENIGNVGCIARDSVKEVGNDLVFLSSSGLRSLKRTIEQDSMPLTDISKHVRDDLISSALNEASSVAVKSCYSEKEGFYLLSLPTAGETWCFDLKFPNQDGTWKVTKWDKAPTALMVSQDQTLYMSDTAGFIQTYTGYKDGVASDGTGGSSYIYDFEGVWNDFGEEVAPLLKILKSVSVLASALSTSNVSFKWAVDYEDAFSSVSLNFVANSPTQYGIGQYGIGTYGGAGAFERVKSPLKLTGQVVKVGIISTIDGDSFALQRLDLLAKTGKLGY